MLIHQDSPKEVKGKNRLRSTRRGNLRRFFNSQISWTFDVLSKTVYYSYQGDVIV